MRYADTTVGGELRFLPETLRMDGQVATQVRHRGYLPGTVVSLADAVDGLTAVSS